MNDLSMLSVSSAYRASANSVYNSAKVSSVKDKQELSNAENSSSALSPNSFASGEINDEAIISDEALTMLAIEKGADKAEPKDQGVKETKNDTPKFAKELTPEQEQVVAELKARDAEVKAHEQAHLAAAAGINASAPTFTYQTGPDGQRYAIGGEVSISFSSSNDPQETISNAETMKAAALAPAEPSGQDLSVANAAEKMIAAARQELAKQEQEEAAAKDAASEAEKAQSGEDTAPMPKDKTNKSEEQPVIGGTAKQGEQPTIGLAKKTDEEPVIGGTAKKDEQAPIVGTKKTEDKETIGVSANADVQPLMGLTPKMNQGPAGLIA